MLLSLLFFVVLIFFPLRVSFVFTYAISTLDVFCAYHRERRAHVVGRRRTFSNAPWLFFFPLHHVELLIVFITASPFETP